ncbi:MULTISPECIES: hypothetical protein [unclassified Spirillospora]
MIRELSSPVVPVHRGGPPKTWHRFRAGRSREGDDADADTGPRTE